MRRAADVDAEYEVFSGMQRFARAALDAELRERCGAEGPDGFEYLPEYPSPAALSNLGLGVRIGSAVAYPTGPRSWLVVRPTPSAWPGGRGCSCLAAWRLSTSEVAALAESVAADV